MGSARAMSPRRHDPSLEHEHGSHTLRVWSGTVVGVNGDDVFCELGPRMQGVISARQFERPPEVGETYEFTLRGREESLWVLALSHSRSLATWEEAEPGSVVEARIVRKTHGGLEAKVGPLHAFLPKSHTGLAREDDPAALVGRVVACEVLEVDAERQRILVSRRKVLERERLGGRQGELGSLTPGQVVNGRVSRVESFGVFVAFGRGLEGLIHVSNLSYERVEDPAELFKKGDSITAKVLSIKRGGKRIALGLRQMQESPWAHLEKVHYVGQVVPVVVTRVAEYGVFALLRAGVEGLVHRSETGVGAERVLRGLFRPGQKLSARILSLDCEEERLSLSLLAQHGALLTPEEAEAARFLEDRDVGEAPRDWGGDMGRILRRALRDESPRDVG